jgi:hypothetical protein
MFHNGLYPSQGNNKILIVLIEESLHNKFALQRRENMDMGT